MQHQFILSCVNLGRSNCNFLFEYFAIAFWHGKNVFFLCAWGRIHSIYSCENVVDLIAIDFDVRPNRLLCVHLAEQEIHHQEGVQLLQS